MLVLEAEKGFCLRHMVFRAKRSICMQLLLTLTIIVMFFMSQKKKKNSAVLLLVIVNMYELAVTPRLAHAFCV